jgi:uncharacterized membrane protein (DUF485 family)
MSVPTGQRAATQRAPAPRAGAIDWRAIARTPEFEALHRSRRRFTLTGMAIETGALLVVMGLYGWAPDTMGKDAIGSVTWALLSGAGLIVLTFVMALVYERKARTWEEMSARAIEHAEPQAEPGRRFER